MTHAQARVVTPEEGEGLLLADILHGAPDKLARVQTLLKPIARGTSSIRQNERLVVADASTAIQFAIEDVMAVVTFVTAALKVSSRVRNATTNGGATARQGTRQTFQALLGRQDT